MRIWLTAVAVGTMLAGCASSQKQARRPMPREAGDSQMATVDAPRPKDLGGAAVKIVAHRPSSKQYRFVGRIEARASSGDIVDAAVAADADLRRQAKALGADVVKLDVIAPPADHSPAHSRIILAGRAYKKAS